MKTYIFGIGGTGARVMRALTMLLATGMEIKTDEIVPIFIDPDASAADLTRTISFLREYKYMNDLLHFTSDTKNRFFKTKISEIIPNYRLELSNTRNDRFRKYMGFDSLDIANQALAYMLFSEKNLDSDMEVGFKGNPNIGSVVLNQFAQSEAFYEFTNSFRPGDRIFLVSSIFGGTGASGFPLLLKNLRGIDMSLPNAGNIKDAAIGAITILPYFNLAQSQDGSNDIDSSTFISKAKAALEYYDTSTLMKIIERSAFILGIEISEDASFEIARRSRGTPRIANSLLRRVRDFAQVKGNGCIDLAIAKYALDALNIDRRGLDSIDNKILRTIITKFKGGPVGINTVATAVGEDPGTVEEVYEPFLIKEGLIMRTPRGREVTDLAYEHLGISKFDPEGGNLF